MKLFWWYFLITLAILITGRVYLTNGFPYTHDGENHLARFANYKIALKEGQFPPRFAPNLQNHYGYPVFNYNYPLANIVSLPFSFLKLNYELTFKFIALSGLGLLAVATANWLTNLGVNRSGQLAAVLALLSSPVVLNMTFFRGNIGELLGLSLTITLLSLIEQSKKTVPHWIWLVLIWTAVLLAHNITSLFAMVFVVLYGLIRLFPLQKNFSLLRLHAVGLGGGILLSLWFWLPALAEKNLIVLDQAASVQEYARHFVTLSQLVFSPLEFGFSYPGSVDTLSFGLGLALLLSWFIFASAVIKAIWQRLTNYTSPLPINAWSVVLFIASTLAIWITTDASNWLWKLLSPLQYAQFPWRFELFAVIGLTALVGFVINSIQVTKPLKGMLLAAIALQLWQASFAKPADYFHRTIVDYDAFSQTTSTQNENRTKEFTYTNISDWQPGPKILSGEGELTTTFWNGSNRRYTVKATTPVIVSEPTMLFAGWQTTANGSPVEYQNSPEIGGRLAYELPPGEYQVHSRFTQQTIPRIIGNSISLVSLLALCLELVLLAKKSLPKKNKLLNKYGSL